MSTDRKLGTATLTIQKQELQCTFRGINHDHFGGILPEPFFFADRKYAPGSPLKWYVWISEPKQELICDELERITELQNLAFTPLRQSMSDEAKSAQMQMKKDEHKHETDGIADALIELGVS